MDGPAAPRHRLLWGALIVFGCVAVTFIAAQVQLRLVLELPADQIGPAKFLVPLVLGSSFGVLIAVVRELLARDRLLRVRLAERERALAEANRDLEVKVAERTRALQSAHEQVLHAQRLEVVGRVAGSVAHDFNNMLTVVFACLEALEPSARADPAVAATVGELRGACERARQLSKQLLMFSRKEACRDEVLALSKLVDGVLPLMRRLVGGAVAVEAEVDPALALRCDRSQLEQVLVNLVVNARDAGARTVRITAQRTAPGIGDHRLRIAVGDDGAGMSAETLRHATEPFFTTKPPGRGTGLGLSVTQSVVQRLGGSLDIDSTEGRGTTISMTLPAASLASAEATPPTASVPGQRAKGTLIMLVEDDAVVRRTVRRLLVGAGFEVVDADSLGAARQALDEHGARLAGLVTDLRLPDGSGAAIIKLLAGRHPGVPALAVTGFLEESDREQLVGVEVLPKPFATKDLLARVHAMVGRA